MPPPFPTFGQTIIRSVDAGFVVEFKGKELTVSKGGPVYRCHEIFMEHSDYEAFRDHPDVKNFAEMKF